MLSVFGFFKQQVATWQRDNIHRSADYVSGGVVALREAGDELATHKDVVDLARTSAALREAEKRARELEHLNKHYDELRRSFQSRYDLAAKQVVKLQGELAVKPTAAPASATKTIRKAGELAAENGSLRQRIKELEAAGHVAAPVEANLLHVVATLRAQLDAERGVVRAGRHATSLPQLYKSLRKILSRTALTVDELRAQAMLAIDTSENVLNGLAPAPTGAREPQSRGGEGQGRG